MLHFRSCQLEPENDVDEGLYAYEFKRAFNLVEVQVSQDIQEMSKAAQLDEILPPLGDGVFFDHRRVFVFGFFARWLSAARQIVLHVRIVNHLEAVKEIEDSFLIKQLRPCGLEIVCILCLRRCSNRVEAFELVEDSLVLRELRDERPDEFSQACVGSFEH